MACLARAPGSGPFQLPEEFQRDGAGLGARGRRAFDQRGVALAIDGPAPRADMLLLCEREENRVGTANDLCRQQRELAARRQDGGFRAAGEFAQ